jgi:hypothetical protein
VRNLIISKRILKTMLKERQYDTERFNPTVNNKGISDSDEANSIKSSAKESKIKQVKVSPDSKVLQKVLAKRHNESEQLEDKAPTKMHYIATN